MYMIEEQDKKFSSFYAVTFYTYSYKYDSLDQESQGHEEEICINYMPVPKEILDTNSQSKLHEYIVQKSMGSSAKYNNKNRNYYQN